MDQQQVFYHIYPLGFCGAPQENDGVQEHRILHILDWLDQLEKLGVTALYLGPIFESDCHGYDTRDYTKIDTRLGTKEDMQQVAAALHQRGIKLILDGVFNHVGRGCPFFQDVLAKREASPYKDWFYIDFNQRDNPDGLSYANWEGHGNLVKWNLDNPQVKDYLLGAVQGWLEDYQIDGLRLDVAYCLNQNFLRELNHFCKSQREDFWLLGEMIGGDYNQLLQPDLCDSVTNYECRKGIFSALNSHNLFEIGHSLHRQFGPEPWCLYRGKALYSFVDNHDVDRLASILQDPRDLPLAYALIFAMPGLPSIYYGSEWAARGQKAGGSDAPLRPYFAKPEWNELTDVIAQLARAHQAVRVWADGDYDQLCLQNEQLAFRRRDSEGQGILCQNSADHDARLNFDAQTGQAEDLLSGEQVAINGGLDLGPKSFRLLYSKW